MPPNLLPKKEISEQPSTSISLNLALPVASSSSRGADKQTSNPTPAIGIDESGLSEIVSLCDESNSALFLQQQMMIEKCIRNQARAKDNRSAKMKRETSREGTKSRKRKSDEASKSQKMTNFFSKKPKV